MQEPEPPVIKPFVFTFSWRRFLVHCGIMGFCVILGLMTWYFGKPPSIRFYETKSEEQLNTVIASHIEMSLNARSSVAIKEAQPLQAELFKGSVYFDIKKDAMDQIEVKVGNAVIKNSGTRFSIEKHDDGSGHIAVADGHVTIHVTSGAYRVNAFEQVDFDGARVSQHRLIAGRDVAPWRTQLR